MSKDEVKEIIAYKRWKFNLIIISIVVAMWIAIDFFISLDLFLTTESAKDFYIFAFTGAFALVCFCPFIVYYAAQMVNLRKNACDYKKINLSITYADRRFVGNREGGVYDCAAHYEEADVTVRFKVYMRYLSHGIDLDQGKIVEVWYNEKDGKAFFANKVKGN